MIYNYPLRATLPLLRFDRTLIYSQCVIVNPQRRVPLTDREPKAILLSGLRLLIVFAELGLTPLVRLSLSLSSYNPRTAFEPLNTIMQHTSLPPSTVQEGPQIRILNLALDIPRLREAICPDTDLEPSEELITQQEWQNAHDTDLDNIYNPARTNLTVWRASVAIAKLRLGSRGDIPEIKQAIESRLSAGESVISECGAARIVQYSQSAEGLLKLRGSDVRGDTFPDSTNSKVTIAQYGALFERASDYTASANEVAQMARLIRDSIRFFPADQKFLSISRFEALSADPTFQQAFQIEDDYKEAAVHAHERLEKAWEHVTEEPLWNTEDQTYADPHLVRLRTMCETRATDRLIKANTGRRSLDDGLSGVPLRLLITDDAETLRVRTSDETIRAGPST